MLTTRQIIVLIIYQRRNKFLKSKRQSRFWVREIYKRRKEEGQFHKLVQEAKLFNHEYFFQLFIMSPQKLEKLLNWVGPLITKDDVRRESISAAERLCVTLRFLVTGDSYASIAASYRISVTTLSRIVPETWSVVWSQLLEYKYVECPKSVSEHRAIAQAFEEKWNFPNCVGAIDGKHVRIQCPKNSGSMYFS